MRRNKIITIYKRSLTFTEIATYTDSLMERLATSYTYTPFGAVEASGNESTRNPIQWSSEIADDELGLVYYNYRHYNTADGRWINRDPIAEEGGLNLYSFVGNRVYETDSKGEMSEKACDELVARVLASPGQYSANIRKIVEYLASKAPKCKYTVDCTCTGSLGSLSRDWKIKINAKRRNNATEVLETLLHELIHAKQYCDDGEWLTDCESVVCQELQAYRESGRCQRTSPTNVRQCVINGAVASAKKFCKYDEAKARMIATTSYGKCYARYGNPFL